MSRLCETGFTSTARTRAPALFLSVWFGDGLLYAVDGEGVDAVVQVAASVGDVGSAGQSVGVECQIAETRQSPRARHRCAVGSGLPGTSHRVSNVDDSPRTNAN